MFYVIYDSDNTNGLTIAADGTTVITVYVRQADTYSWTFVALGSSNDNGDTLYDLGYTKEGTCWEGDAVGFVYPAYLLYDNTLYSKGTTSSKNYYYSFTPTYDKFRQEFFYYALEVDKLVVDNVVFFSEAEDIKTKLEAEGAKITLK